MQRLSRFSLALFAMALGITLSGCAQHRKDDRIGKAIHVPQQANGLPVLLIPQQQAGKRSGALNEVDWSQASVVGLDDLGRRKTPDLTTDVHVLCTSRNLYIAFDCEEPDTSSLITTTPEIWQRDSIEIFIEPREDLIHRPYHHIAIDAEGRAVFERYHLYTRYFRLKAYEENWKPDAEVQVSKVQAGWRCMVRLSWDDLHLTDDAREGGLWRLNFCRSRPAREKEGDMYWSWSPLNGGFQTPTRFGYAIPQVFVTENTVTRLGELPADAIDPSAAFASLPESVAMVESLVTETIEGNVSAKKKLQSIAYEGDAAYRLVETKLQDAQKPLTGAEWTKVRTILYELNRDRPHEDPPAPSVLRIIESLKPREQVDEEGNRLAYRLMEPRKRKVGAKYPLLVFLHGSAERGTDNWRQLDGGVLDYVTDEFQDAHPCYVMAPQSPPGLPWIDTRSNAESVAALKATSNYRMSEKPTPAAMLLLKTIDTELNNNPAIDSDRIYLAGTSMGGFATYELLMRRPNFFAAGMVMCGGGDETRAALIAKVPLWIFHGALDKNVNVQASRNMVDALTKAGGHPRYTEFPDRPHGLGNPNMSPEALEWLFTQKRN
jgi:poly(3-hydroxybutyrate) depolymerase